MPDTILARLLRQGRTQPEATAYFYKRGDVWQPETFRTYAEQVKTVGRALTALGIHTGDTVSFLGFNRPEWAIVDLAAMAAGGAAAGIYTTCSPDEVAYIIQHAASKVAVLENAHQWEKVEAKLDELPNLDWVVLMKGTQIDHPKVLSWEDMLAKAEAVEESEIEARIDALEMDQLATLIYTSGTTGPPKGVMLTHDNLTWTCDRVKSILPVGPGHCSVSYLPLSHIAEQMFTLHIPITYGFPVYFAESLEKLPQNLVEVQPTIVFGVPRIWEKMSAKVAEKLEEAPPNKKRIANWAMAVGCQVVGLRNQGKSPGPWLSLQHRIANRLVYRKALTAMGLSRAQYCVSGAAPISKEVLEWFGGLNLTIHEVYGQSEDTGPTTFNAPGRTRYGTVGPAVPGVEVRIADDGEILVRGRNVFKGYYKNPEATAETLVDGWLHSGDLGAFDDDGFLHITGRKKDIIITAGGKNIAPKNIEAALKLHPLIAEAVVIGDRRKFLSALICLDDEAIVRWAEERGLPAAASELCTNATLIEEIQRTVDEDVNPQFARVEHIRKFKVLPRMLSVDDGELTPTLKVKRRIVDEHFSDEIEAIYA